MGLHPRGLEKRRLLAGRRRLRDRGSSVFFRIRRLAGRLGHRNRGRGENHENQDFRYDRRLLRARPLRPLAGLRRRPDKVGAIFGVTGPAAYLGAPEEKTARMLIDDINKSGGILGRQVQLIVKDSGASTEKAISFAKQLIEEEGVVAIVGPTTSGESMAIKGICQSAKVPLISCASAKTIVVPVSKYVFKTPQKDN